MKNIELKLLVEGVGEYTFRGKAEDSCSPVNWTEHGGDLDMGDYMQSNGARTLLQEHERLFVFADNLYHDRNFSTIINYRESN